MLRVLLRQELTRLWPWIAVLAATDVAWYLLSFFKSVPDSTLWVTDVGLFESSHYSERATVFLALLFCQAGFPRDADEGTDVFLFSLPVPRAQIFLGRVLAPGLILTADVLFSQLLHGLSHLPSAGSFGGRTFRLEWQLQWLFLSLALVWISVGYAQLLTVFRRFGVLLLVAFYLLLSSWQDSAGWLRALDPTSVMQVQFAGQRALLSWSVLLGHALAALGACGLAALFWVGPMERVTESFARWARKPVLGWSVGALIAGAVVAYLAQRGEPESKPAPSGYGVARPQLDTTAVVVRTRRHELTYPRGLAARIEPLAAVADELHEQLAERLGVPLGDDVVVVDFTRGSATHAGSATWNTIRMDPFASSDAESLERVFAHESVHVLSLRATERRLSSEAEAVGFFSEGLAEALALTLRPSQPAAEALRLEAVLAYRRLRLTFGQLIRYQSFTERHGPQLVYPIGFTWAEALIGSCGRAAPERVLRALGSGDVPLRLAPEGLWQHLLQRAGCDIARVNAAWESQLAASETALSAELALVPELQGGIVRRQGDEVRLLAHVEGEPPDGTVFFASVRASGRGNDAVGTPLFAQRRADGALEFRVPPGLVVDGSLQFQLGLRLERQGFPVRFAQEWTKGRVER
jgi:hypothetical protein